MSQIRNTEASARAARYEDGFRVLQGRREYVTYQADSSIRIWYSDIPWRYETHNRSAVEILLTLEGMVTEVRPLQPLKALSPMLVTESPMVTEVMLLQ